MGRKKRADNLFEMPPARPIRKHRTVARRDKAQMVADTLQMLFLAQTIESGAELSDEDRRWLASRLRRLVVGDEPNEVFFPGHRKGTGPRQLRNLAIALSFHDKRLQSPPMKAVVAVKRVSATYGVGEETAKAACKEWNKRRLKSVMERLDPQSRAMLAAILESAFLEGLNDGSG